MIPLIYSVCITHRDMMQSTEKDAEVEKYCKQDVINADLKYLKNPLCKWIFRALHICKTSWMWMDLSISAVELQ